MNQNVKNITPINSPINTDKPSLSTIFKRSLLNQKKNKKSKLKKGWILLTKNGIIDSLTSDERKQEDESYNERIIKINLQRLVAENEKKLQLRRENDPTYLWEELRIVDEYEMIESDEEYDYDSLEDYYHSEDDYYDNYGYNKNNKEIW